MLYFDLFDRRYLDAAPKTGIVIPSDLNYLRRLYAFNLEQIQEYFLSRNFSVKNTHILSRFIEHFPLYLNYDEYQYLQYASDKGKYLAKHFKMTSDIEKGIVHSSHFFNRDCDEILFASEESFDLSRLRSHWKTENVIKTLKHPRNDLKLLLPLGNEDDANVGLTVLQINIPKLAMKYRYFMKEQYLSSQTGGRVLNKNNFVIKYVLSAMMADVIDHTFLNRIMDRFYNVPYKEPEGKHRFKLYEPTTQVTRYVDNILDVITNKKVDFVNLLRNIPLMFSEDASELLALDDLGYTSQVKWALLSSRLDHMCFIYDIARAKDMNRNFINDFKNFVKRVGQDNLLNDKFSYEIEKEIKEKLYKVSQM